MPITDQKLTSKLLRLDAASRALLLEMDSTVEVDHLTTGEGETNYFSSNRASGGAEALQEPEKPLSDAKI
jgi:hypothetical protein